MSADMKEINAALVKHGIEPVPVGEIQANHLQGAVNAIRKFGNQFEGLLALAKQMEQGAGVMQTIDEAHRRQAALAAEEVQIRERLAAVRSELAAESSLLVEAKSGAERIVAGAQTAAAKIIDQAQEQAAAVIARANADKAAAAKDRAEAARILTRVQA
jgi:hypothetical protein